MDIVFKLLGEQFDGLLHIKLLHHLRLADSGH